MAFSMQQEPVKTREHLQKAKCFEGFWMLQGFGPRLTMAHHAKEPTGVEPELFFGVHPRLNCLALW